MVLAVAIATIPLIYACRHQHRYGTHGSDPHRREVSRVAATPREHIDSHIVCPNCAALVADQAVHDGSLHAVAIT
jgi:rubredoxin